MLTVFLYVCLGSVSELLITLYYRCMMARRVGLTTGLSMSADLLNFFIITEIVVSKKYFLILAYVLGRGIGTFAGMKINIKEREDDRQN